MNLVLRCIALNDQAMSQPLIGRFDRRGGTLGRSDDATLTLPDPERMISRLQAQVLYRDGQYWIENVSNVSPILHNGHPVGTGMRVALHDADELRIGGYALQAAFENDPESDTILRGRTVVPGLLPAVALEALPASSQSAPELLVTPSSASPARDILTGPAAQRDALTDLQSHQTGMTAGMRAVLEAVLDRLNPKKLEALLGKRAFLDYLRPMRRRVRLWELYLNKYDELCEEAQADFQRSLGETFRAAYEAQLRNSNAGSDKTVIRGHRD